MEQTSEMELLMTEPAKERATYNDLYTIPENMIGEIIGGDLIVSPQPSPRHSNTAFTLSGILGPPYRFGQGGPGGWIILAEVEVMLGEHLLVPDFSGWRKKRFPGLPEVNYLSVSPDWICEILSPSTMRTDRIRKMPIYAHFGVKHLWLIDPVAKTLEVYALESGRWLVLGLYGENDLVRAEPFQDIEIDLGNLWIE
jgi:Uma2 family endonuclease